MDMILDIETIGNEEMIKILPELDVKTGNLKDESKIIAKVEQAKQNQIEKMGLSPYHGKLCCFGVIKDDGEPLTYIGKDEKVLLNILANEMIQRPRIITYNGFDFDIPFLHFRYIFHGIKSPFTTEYFKKYSIDTHYDIFMELTGWRGISSNNSISLNNLGKVFGFKVEDGFSGKKVQEAWNNKEYKEIEDHCKNDIILTKQIFERFKN